MEPDPRSDDEITAGSGAVVEEGIDRVRLQVTAFLGEGVTRSENVELISRGARRHDVRVRRIVCSTEVELDPVLLCACVEHLIHRVVLSTSHEQVVRRAVEHVSELWREADRSANHPERLQLETLRSELVQRVDGAVVPDSLRVGA